MDLENVEPGETLTVAVAQQTNPNIPKYLCKPELLANIGYSMRMEAEDINLSMCP